MYDFVSHGNDFGKDRKNSAYIENLTRIQPNFSDPSRISNRTKDVT